MQRLKTYLAICSLTLTLAAIGCHSHSMSEKYFLIANNLVLVPTFNDPSDRVALNILAELMPRHDIVGIYCGDFVWGLGTIHCASQQEPS